ncbi:MAG: MFS transporter [Caulobacterales bacterium]
MARRWGELWRHADFMRLWSAQAVSSFGARIAREGVPMMAVAALHAGPVALGVVAALRLAPAVLVGLVGGPVVDRLPHRPVLIFADLARALVLAAIPLAALTGKVTLAEVYFAALAMGGLNVVFDMADHAYLPRLIARDLLLEGNAKLSATDSVAETGGPALAGILFQLLTAPIAVAVTAGTYLVSALFLSTIRARPPVTPAEDEAPSLLDVTAGLRACLTHPLVRPLMLSGVMSSFFGYFFSALYIIYCVNVAHLDLAMLGFTIAAGGVGGLVGAGAVQALTRRLGVGRAIVLTGLAGGVSTFLVPLAGGAPLLAMAVLVLAQLFGDAFATVSDIGSNALRQSVLGPAVLGRARGAFAAAGGLAGVLGALVGGFLGQALGARETLFIAAAGVAAAPLIGLFSPLWRATDTVAA